MAKKTKNPGQPSKLAQSTRNTRIIAKSITGKTTSEIAKEEGVTRMTVSRTLNHSEEAKKYERIVRERFEKLIETSLNTIERVVSRDDPDSDPTALKAAIYTVERIAGKIQEKVKVTVEEEFKNLDRAQLLELLQRELSDDTAEEIPQ